MKKNILSVLVILISTVISNGCASNTLSNPYSNQPASSLPSARPQIDTAMWQGDAYTTWNQLQNMPPKQLKSINANDPTMTGWVKLAIISKQDSNNISQLTQDLAAWRTEYPNHPGNSLFPDDATLTQLGSIHSPQHYAMILPLSGPLGKQGKTVRDGFLKAYYANQSKTHQVQAISFYDSNQNKDISSLYQKALTDGADFIVGPLTKQDVQSLSSQGKISIPTLALNYTDSSLPANLYQFGLSPTDEIKQVADKAKSDGLSKAVIITTDNDWGHRIASSLTSRWQTNGGNVVEVLYVTPKMNLAESIAALFHVDARTNKNKSASLDDNNRALQEQKHRHDIDVVFLLTPPQMARAVVPLIKFYYIGHLPIYSTSVIYSGSSSPQDADLNSVIFCDTPASIYGQNSNRLFAVGIDAYSLSNQFNRLTTLPNFPVYGATGALTLNSQNQIFRRLPWTTMHDGHT